MSDNQQTTQPPTPASPAPSTADVDVKVIRASEGTAGEAATFPRPAQ